MPGLTPDDETKIDLKFAKFKDEIKKEISEDQKESNKMIREIHQEIIGYGERKGILAISNDHECRLDDHDTRLKDLEENNKGKIETRKAVFGMFGSAGFGGAAIWILSQIFGGK